ncbi:MAG: hypothetical protein KC503_28000 [Myxococcales bacterium]|nr:hypothetical protein [Myxococcales bacterium]
MKHTIRKPLAARIAVLLLVIAVGCGGAMLATGRAPADAQAAPGKVALRGKRPKQPIELGGVRWRRGLPSALAASKKSGKPVLVLFDEVPGCSTVRGFGRTVLSHPLIVEAAETLFVPLLVYNNKGGVDRRVLNAFGEPTWNNPVVRIIDHQRRALATRYASTYTVRSFARAMVQGLRKAGRKVPGYLAALASPRRAERATFAMHCFWTGEVRLGAIPGVLETRPGFLDGREVVEVRFDPRKLSYGELVKRARALGVASRVYAHDAAQLAAGRAVAGSAVSLTARRMRVSPKDDKYQLIHSRWRAVPLTAEQATRLNAALPVGRLPQGLLSPRQLALYRTLAASGSSASALRGCQRAGYGWIRVCAR